MTLTPPSSQNRRNRCEYFVSRSMIIYLLPARCHQSTAAAVRVSAHYGYTHRASKDKPQYEIKGDKSEHIAAHKGKALRKID